jgi:glutaredoxin
VRCKTHDLACGPDGRCVVCRREGGAGGSATARVWAGVAVLGVAMGSAAAYRTLGARRVPLAIAPELIVRAPAAGPSPPDEPRPTPATPGDDGLANQHRAFSEARAMYEAHASAATTSPPPTSTTAAASAPEAKASSPDPAPTISLGDVSVVVYTTGWCSVCKRAKAWMSGQGIAYEERNIEDSSEYASAMHAINPRGSVPTFDVDGDVMIGFSEQSLVAAMTRAARRQAARRRM